MKEIVTNIDMCIIHNEIGRKGGRVVREGGREERESERGERGESERDG